MSQVLDIVQFMEHAQAIPILDVRSPSEFAKAHIPGAISFPLFSDEERAAVGTMYTQTSKQKAIILGLDFAGPKLGNFVREAFKIAPNGHIGLHCWRGGMRSASMAWLLETAGLNVFTLKGGYKTFRNLMHQQFARGWNIISLGGFTGSGKTEVLVQMKTLGEQVIDLEDLACHLGSAFGSLGKLIQPGQEMFENLLGLALYHLDIGRPVWLEDESINLGKLQIPAEIWKTLQKAPLMRLNIPRNARLNFIMERYGLLKPEFLKESILKISKRIGNENMNIVLHSIEGGELREAAGVVLDYYDHCYSKSLEKRKPETYFELNFQSLVTEAIAQELIARSLSLI